MEASLSSAVRGPWVLRTRRRSRVIAVVGSICLHLVGGAWLLQTRHDARPSGSPPIAVEIVSLEALEPDRPTPRPPVAPRRSAGRDARPAGDIAPAPGPVGDADDLAAAVFAQPRSRPAIKARVDCLNTEPDRMSAADRERCERGGRPPGGPVSVASSKEKADQLQAAAERKAAIVLYRNTITAPYPGLNCVYRGRCSK